MVFRRISHAAVLAAGALACALTAPAQAGQLVLENTSDGPIDCAIDGWAGASIATAPHTLTLAPGTTHSIPPYVPIVAPPAAAPAGAKAPSETRSGRMIGATAPAIANPPTIHWAKCGTLVFQPINVTPNGPDLHLTLNGQQTRTLKVSLYPYIPNLPNTDFSALLTQVRSSYQAQNPQVALIASMDENIDIYDFASLTQLLSSGAFDVIELDMLYIGFLANSGLINPARPVGDKPLPVAMAAATVAGTLWAVPSWLCMDFIYSRDSNVQKVNSVKTLQQFLFARPSSVPVIAADFNGSWRMPSIYTNAYVQTYGKGQIAQAQTMPPDATAMNNLATLVNFCTNVLTMINPCGNRTYHSLTPGTIEAQFALQTVQTVVGFSEQSFYINLALPQQLFVAPMPWAGQPQPLLFSDGFVTNSTSCPTGSTCAGDADALIKLMTSAGMKAYIVESMDLPQGSPWRTLLSATMPFYKRPEIAGNALYQQYTRVFQTAVPFPNNFTATVEQSMDQGVCKALKKGVFGYAC